MKRITGSVPMVLILVLALSLCGLSPPSTAADCRTPENMESDEVFAACPGPDNDLGRYVFGPGGSIRIPINITRVFSKTKPLNPNVLVEQPRLVLKVWNGQRRCSDNCVEISINGHVLPNANLEGTPCSWSPTILDIPQEWFTESGVIQDATYNGLGIEPTAGINEIRININGEGSIRVDQAEIHMKGMRPAALIPGINLKFWNLDHNQDTWEIFQKYIPGNLTEICGVEWLGSTVINGLIIRNKHIPDILKSFGVSKINLIGHSKGGLDSSFAALGSSDLIDNIITIGSPLQGTELANHILAYHPQWALIHPSYKGLSIAYELSTIQRSIYYTIFDSPENGVKDHYMAGNKFKAEETLCPLYWDGCALYRLGRLRIFDVENDGAVPVDRAFPVWRKGADASRTLDHGGLTKDRGVAEWAVALMKSSVVGLKASFSSQSDKASLKKMSLSIPTMSTSSDVQQVEEFSGTLAAGETRTYTYQIDPNVTQMNFHLAFSPDADSVQVTLMSPSGRLTKLIRASEFAGFAQVFKSPAKGNWQVIVNSADAIQFVGGADLVTTLKLSASADKDTYAYGEPIQITALIEKDSTSVTGASVKAHVMNSTGILDSFTLSDIGQGNYAGSYSPPEGGMFSINIIADGTYAGKAFQRSSYIPLITVAPETASVAAITSESANDTDGNKLFNNLTLAMDVDAIVEGEYSINGSLEATDGTRIANALTAVHLAAGINPVELVFSGKTIHDSGTNGPYKLSRLNILDLQKGGLSTYAAYDSYVTKSYKFSDFEGPILSFNGSGREQLLDTDADGFYDQLVIELDVVVHPRHAKHYTFTAQLLDPEGNTIEWYANRNALLKSGLNSLQLVFTGRTIASSGFDGPYRVGNFLLYQNKDPNITLSSSPAYTTSAYRACQFQGSDPCVDNLKVSTAGVGSGMIMSNPSGIECRTTCSADFQTGETVTLTPLADAGWVFTGWSGCDLISDDQCVESIDGAKSVTASFGYFSVHPREGTVGTELALTGSNFGSKKGKVTMGKTTLKILHWEDKLIRCSLERAMPAGAYNIVVYPYGPKGTASIPEKGAFTVKYPTIRSITPEVGKPGDIIQLGGKYFGKNRGTVSMGYEVGGKQKTVNCSTSGWSMDKVTGDSLTKFNVSKSRNIPKGLVTINLKNAVGKCIMTGAFTVQ